MVSGSSGGGVEELLERMGVVVGEKERARGGAEGEMVVGVGQRREGTETRAESGLRIVRVRVL